MMLTLLLAATFSKPREVTCETVQRGTVVTLTPGLPASIKLEGSNLRIRLPRRADTLLKGVCADKNLQRFAPVRLLDLNFDGADDIAVLDGIGYGSVNVYYQMYLIQKAGGILRGSARRPAWTGLRYFRWPRGSSGTVWRLDICKIREQQRTCYSRMVAPQQPEIARLTQPTVP